jgi:hypothetical protein
MKNGKEIRSLVMRKQVGKRFESKMGLYKRISDKVIKRIAQEG